MTGIGMAGSNCTGASIGADERQPWLLDWLTILDWLTLLDRLTLLDWLTLLDRLTLIGARRAGRRHF
jgi:hypothetical protein